MSSERTTLQRNPRSFPYELRTFPARMVDGKVPEEVATWQQGVSLGFHGNVPTPETNRNVTSGTTEHTAVAASMRISELR